MGRSGEVQATTRKLAMSNRTKHISTIHHLLETIPAANADQIGAHARRDAVERTAVEPQATSTGWDSYQVWRRFIKEARDRRRSES
jgi:hypothetical protein